MAEVNIPDEAAEAFRRVKIGYGFEPRGSDIEALRAAAPLIVAAELERLADGGWSPDRYTAAGQLIPRAVILARAAELRGGA